MHDKIATITGRRLASRAIKQLNEHITTAVLMLILLKSVPHSIW